MGNYISHQYIFCPPQRPTFATYQSLISNIQLAGNTSTPQINLYNIPMYNNTDCYIDATIFITEIKIKGSKKAIIWSYGNACDMHIMLPILVNIAQTLQTTIYLYDYPGYGLSGGVSSETACIETLGAVVRSAIMRNRITPQQLILIGQSLGSAITVGFAHKHRDTVIPGQIILVSPFKSVAALINARSITEYVYTFTGGDAFSTANKIGNIATPIKIYHGKLDTVIPFQHSTELQKLHSGTRLILLPYANHNNILEHINMITLLD